MPEAVNVNYDLPSIAIVSFEDEVTKNAFSKPMMANMQKIFNDIKNNNTIKVVVVHATGNYFSTGADKELLMELLDEKKQYAELDCYRKLLDCEVPTIAAMNGHAIGGGLALGLLADIVVLAEECYYTTLFMRMGFTPLEGTTCLMIEKFGMLLGAEMLFTAKNYQGKELKDRGVTANVVKKKDVLNVALGYAKELAKMPLISLKLLKQQLTKDLKVNFAEAQKDEHEMYKKTFIGNDEVRKNISKL